MRSAVCALLVVAPPISSGVRQALALHLAGDRHHFIERGRDQPRQPDHVRTLSLADFKMSCHGTITPRSMTSKPLHCSTTPTMFLPMS